MNALYPGWRITFAKKSEREPAPQGRDVECDHDPSGVHERDSVAQPEPRSAKK